MCTLITSSSPCHIFIFIDILYIYTIFRNQRYQISFKIAFSQWKREHIYISVHHPNPSPFLYPQLLLTLSIPAERLHWSQ